MQVHLEFAAFFSVLLGDKGLTLDVPERATLADVVNRFLQEEPEKAEILKRQKLFLQGKLRAVYMKNGRILRWDEQLRNQDTVKILKAFVGG